MFGSFVFHFLILGIPQSFGVIYSEIVSAFELGEGEIGWIPSLYTGMLFGTGKYVQTCIFTLNNYFQDLDKSN